MRHALLMLGLLCCASFAVADDMAGADKPAAGKTMDKKTGWHKGMKGVCQQDGKIVMLHGKKTMPMKKEMKLKDGTTVGADGKVVKTDGTATTIVEGQCLMMDGTMKSLVDAKAGVPGPDKDMDKDLKKGAGDAAAPAEKK